MLLTVTILLVTGHLDGKGRQLAGPTISDNIL